MIEVKRISTLLYEIAYILKENEEFDWHDTFIGLSTHVDSDPLFVCSKIRSLYGGMGSFTDLVLHDSKGIPLREENNRLDHLRKKLYELCCNVKQEGRG